MPRLYNTYVILIIVMYPSLHAFLCKVKELCICKAIWQFKVALSIYIMLPLIVNIVNEEFTAFCGLRSIALLVSRALNSTTTNCLIELHSYICFQPGLTPTATGLLERILKL